MVMVDERLTVVNALIDHARGIESDETACQQKFARDLYLAAFHIASSLAHDMYKDAMYCEAKEKGV